MDKTIFERIKQRIREHGQNYKINQLCLDELPINQLTIQITKTIQKCLNIQYLTLQHCSLRSLQNLPRLPKLQNLQLGYNQIPGQWLKKLVKYNNLRNLNLRNNKIESLEHIKQLLPCKQLTKLILAGNPISKQNYRNQIFNILPQIEIIDGTDRSGQNVNEQSPSIHSSQFSSQSESESEGQQQRQSPTKIKRRN